MPDPTGPHPQGAVALVTGAGQAVGRTIAEDLAARGAVVAVNDVDAGRAAATVERIVAVGGTALAVPADISREDEVAGIVDAMLAGHGRLDLAVNNAGRDIAVEVADSTAEQFAQLLATNLEGVRACLKHEIRAMRANGPAGGAIVNISSVTSDLTAVPSNGLYGATKGGVTALTKAAAIEVAAEGIAVNALAFIGADAPGSMFERFLADTGMPEADILSAIPAGRRMRSAELCAALRYLTSPDARFVVGTTLVLDGGFTAR